MPVSKKLFPMIPATKHGFLLKNNIFYPSKEDQYSMIPSRGIYTPFSFAEIEWPELKETEGGYPGEYELELKKRKVIRIYCKHQAKYNTQKPQKNEEGQGTLDSPFVCLASALRAAHCFLGDGYSQETCFFVEILIMDGSDTIEHDGADVPTIHGWNRLMISGDSEEFTIGGVISDYIRTNIIINKCKFLHASMIPGCDLFQSTVSDTGIGGVRHIINCNIYSSDANSYMEIETTSVMYGTSVKNVQHISVDNICKCTIENVKQLEGHANIAHSTITTSPADVGVVTLFRFFYNMWCGWITNSTIHNFNVHCDHLINSTLSFSKIDFKTANMGDRQFGSSVSETLSDSKVEYSFIARPIPYTSSHYITTFTAIGVQAGKNCAINNADCTVSIEIRDPRENDSSVDAGAGAGYYVVCDLAQLTETDGRKCISGCRGGAYNFVDDEDFDPSDFKVDCNNI